MMKYTVELLDDEIMHFWEEIACVNSLKLYIRLFFTLNILVC